MGNHQAGRAIGQTVLALIERRQRGESALHLLDIACEPYRGCDAEFEAIDPNNPSQIHPDYADYRFLPSPMAVLMVEAFAPHGRFDIPRYESEHKRELDPRPEDNGYYESSYYDEVVEPFKKRYEFC